jgi:transcriptional regulator with XRE-family HTH domain
VATRSTFGRRLRALRLIRGLSQVEVAARVGRHQTAIGPYERDEYEPPREVVERLALVLDTSPEYLYFGRNPQQIALPVVGRVGRAGLAESLAEAESGLIGLRDVQLRGYLVNDDSMAPVFRPRQLVLVLAAPADELGQQLGRDALVELADGRTLLRRLMPGADPDRYDLSAYNAPALVNVEARSATPVVGALWPGAWRDTPAADSARAVTLMVDEKF